MSRFPIQPKLKDYRGSDAKRQRQISEYNAAAQKIADYVNRSVANNREETQTHAFQDIAYRLGYSLDDVWSAISNGGHTAIRFERIDDEDRRALEGYKSSP